MDGFAFSAASAKDGERILGEDSVSAETVLRTEVHTACATAEAGGAAVGKFCLPPLSPFNRNTLRKLGFYRVRDIPKWFNDGRHI